MRYLLVGLSLLGAWLGMQASHELGHVAMALATGASVENVDLWPLHLSRTDIGINPSPLAVVWSGPIAGVVVPLALWGATAALFSRVAFMARFFASFCLVANGAYIGVGSFDGIGDCGEMLRHGSPIWMLWLFGAAAVAAGFAAWHGLAAPYGFGPNAQPVAPSSVVTAGAFFVVVLVVAAVVGT